MGAIRHRLHTNTRTAHADDCECIYVKIDLKINRGNTLCGTLVFFKSDIASTNVPPNLATSPELPTMPIQS